MDAMDEDQSGELDWDEFVKVVQQSLKLPSKEEEVDEAFVAMGGDRKHQQAISTKLIRQTLDEFDLRLDEELAERISFKEFKALVMPSTQDST